MLKAASTRIPTFLKPISILALNHRTSRRVGGGGSTPLSKPYRYVPPQRVGCLHHFGLKTGIHFAYFGLESGMVFEGTTGVYERIYRLSKER